MPLTFVRADAARIRGIGRNSRNWSALCGFDPKWADIADCLFLQKSFTRSERQFDGRDMASLV